MQLVWLMLAIWFHVVSLVRIKLGMNSLSLNSPTGSIAFLSLFAGVIYLGWKSYYLLFFVFNTVLITVIFYKGLLFQLLDFAIGNDLTAYPSVMAWYIGMLINLYGIPVSYTACFLAFKKYKSAGSTL